MATERQIAANRCNAGRSTGPRSTAGKKRASRSSYRHGLRARAALGVETAKRIERLARKIAGHTTDAIILEGARGAAQAEFDIAHVRQVKLAVIQHMQAIGECDAPPSSLTTRQTRMSTAPAEAEATMPPTEQECLAEAVQRALPELLVLDRYECRAMARRDRSVQIILDRRRNLSNQ
jgi:hypothetical protein